MKPKAVSRREFLRVAGLSGVAAVTLAACAPPAPAQAPNAAGADANATPAEQPSGTETANIRKARLRIRVLMPPDCIPSAALPKTFLKRRLDIEFVALR